MIKHRKTKIYQKRNKKQRKQLKERYNTQNKQNIFNQIGDLCSFLPGGIVGNVTSVVIDIRSVFGAFS